MGTGSAVSCTVRRIFPLSSLGGFRHYVDPAASMTFPFGRIAYTRGLLACWSPTSHMDFGQAKN